MNATSKYLVYSCVALVWLLQACGKNDDLSTPKESLITGLAAPIVLQPDSTIIALQDFFDNPKAIDSIFMDERLDFRITNDSSQLIITPNEKNIPKLSLMTVWADGFSYTLILEKSPKVWVHFSFDPKGKKYNSVLMRGEMNDWNAQKTKLTLKDDHWETDLFLFPGKYQYLLVADGKQMLDPSNPDIADNNIGGFNSVLWAGNIKSPAAPELWTEKAEDNKITLGIRNKAKNIFILWENFLLPDKFFKTDSSGIHISVPRKARQFDRSYIRVWAYNSNGISNQILLPLHNGMIIKDAGELNRNDKEAMIMYFLMIDRFNNGDTKNDAPLKDKAVDWKANFQGGDLDGITEKIKDGYFAELGINTLWISPLTQNPLDAWAEYPPPHRKFSGYHGYWPMTLSTVDSRFGQADDLKKLVNEAHDNKMNVILDYVSNHVHQECYLIKEHPEWATQLNLPGKRKNIRLWDEQRLTTWFDEFLPTLDLSKPEVYQLISDSSLFLLREYQLDGFRHDATKHIPEIYWRTLTKKIKEQIILGEKRPVYQIGETFGSRDLIRSYINPGMLDAQFDFNLYFDARTAFARENSSLKDLAYSLQQSFNYYGTHSLMGNITGNQDLARFISFASGAISFSEDDKKAGWERQIEVQDTLGYRKLGCLMAFVMTIPGVPIIYYGDEFGMAGGGDPDNRRMMKFEGLTKHEASLKNTTARLAKLRSENLSLIFGDFLTLKVSEKTFVFLRSYFDQLAIVVFNKDKNRKNIAFKIPERFTEKQLGSCFGNTFTREKNDISISLEGNSFDILINKKP